MRSPKAAKTKRYALFLAVKDSDYVKKLYGGYFNVFVDALGHEGETWDLFRVVEGDFPAIDELENYEAFVISGSTHDAHWNDPWVLQLCHLLRIIISMRKKVLGVCVSGARALGGRVAKAQSGWDVGIRKVTLLKELLPFNFNCYELDDIPSSLAIIKCHQDEVWEVPKGANVIAYSDKTGVEMFSFGKNVLEIQGHPEYTKDIFNNLIDRLHSMDYIEKRMVEKAKSSLSIIDPDRKFWEQICKGFLCWDCQAHHISH